MNRPGTGNYGLARFATCERVSEHLVICGLLEI